MLKWPEWVSPPGCRIPAGLDERLVPLVLGLVTLPRPALTQVDSWGLPASAGERARARLQSQGDVRGLGVGVPGWGSGGPCVLGLLGLTQAGLVPTLPSRWVGGAPGFFPRPGDLFFYLSRQTSCRVTERANHDALAATIHFSGAPAHCRVRLASAGAAMGQ